MKKHGLLLLILIILTFNSFAQTAAQIKRADKLVQQGNDFSDKKEWDKAIASYLEVIKIRPNRPNGWYNLGLAKFQQATETPLKPGIDPIKTLESAAADFTQSIKLNSKTADVWIMRGNVYWWLQNADADRFRPLAIADFTQALKLDPKSETALFQRGDCYLRNLEYDKAIADFTRIFQLNPKNDEALIKRGVAYRFQNKIGLSIIDFETAAKINPNGNGKSSLQGAMYQLNKNDRPYEVISIEAKNALEIGEADHAIALYQKSIELLPVDWKTDELLALSYNSEKSFSLAKIGQAYILKKDFDKALISYETAIKPLWDALAVRKKWVDEKYKVTSNDENMIRTINLRLIFSERDLNSWEKLVEISRTANKLLSAQSLNINQKTRLAALQLSETLFSQSAAAEFSTVATDQYLLAALCKDKAAYYCGINTRNDLFTKNYNKMLNTINKAIEIYPKLKMSYEQRANIYRLMGRNDLAAADEQTASQLNND